MEALGLKTEDYVTGIEILLQKLDRPRVIVHRELRQEEIDRLTRVIEEFRLRPEKQ